MTFEEQKEKRRQENKQLKEYLRRGHRPAYQGNMAIFLSGDRYLIPTNKNGDKFLGFRKLKNAEEQS